MSDSRIVTATITGDLSKIVEMAKAMNLSYIVLQSESVIDLTTESATTEDTLAPTHKDVTINSLSDTPTIQFEVSDRNCIAVDDFEFIDGTCATQNVTLMGRTILMNICDDGDGATIKLDIEIDGKFLKQVPFKLNKDGKNCISL